ncbi:response regulator [Parvularcula dongshanensis]|uniref:histidine kinase n=1 Tax=Parvularcula dongshanensis TaxID=1173995 RepID=A0A840I654_9PROT|nr:response regulator [Parvularcula dongshanensis]MBB4659892.1 signal transduction histidine kinase/CheY-like chemotaxis protein [Parvularcula dongshanensis]
MTPSQDLLDSLSLLSILTDEEDRIVRMGAETWALGTVMAGLKGEVFGAQGVPAPLKITRRQRIDGHRHIEDFTTALDAGEGMQLIQWRGSRLSTGTLYLGLDVTRDRAAWRELKALAKTAADASESKMRFLATMSHEMRTPLNGILGMTGLLLDTGLDANQTAYAEAVRESGSALLGLINDILDYSKIEAGHLELDDHVFDPAGLVQSVSELLSPRAAHKDLEIAAYVSPEVPARLRGDEGRLRQVLLNLGGNGVKFTEEGGVSIEVKSKALGDGRHSLRVEVRDTGIGISPQATQTIFEEFAQADETRARAHEGTGLGLSIARRIVRAMGGDVTVESTLGQGSTFAFEVPLMAEGNARQPVTTPPRAPVVVATTSDILARILSLQLRALGVGGFDIAGNADEAAKYLQRSPGAILLCDLPIAAVAGQRLAKLASRAIVMLSPVARGRLEAFRRAGFDGYLIKPIRQASLAERLSTRDAVPDKPTEPARLDAPALAAKPTGDKKRILLAEDNQINAVLATAIIRRAGHHVDVAGNGREAIEALEQAPYDLVLMDMHMPVMDGLEATKRIRAAGGEDANLPIIALTANAMRTDREICLEVGMDDFLSKPFDPADLIAVIDQWTTGEKAKARGAA